MKSRRGGHCKQIAQTSSGDLRPFSGGETLNDAKSVTSSATSERVQQFTPGGNARRTLDELKARVDPAWWLTDEGRAWLRRYDAREQWAVWLEQFGFDSWFTVTVDQKKCRCWQTGLQAMESIERHLKTVCKELHIPCESFLVSEEHKSGLYHVHGLLKVKAINDDFRRLALGGFWRRFFEKFGRSSFEMMTDSFNVRSYVSKYLTKSRNEVEWRLLGFAKTKFDIFAQS
jgi:hypothetical protein